MFIHTHPEVAAWSISGHDGRRLQNAIGFRGCDICLNEPVLLGPVDRGPPPLPSGVTIRGMPLTLPVLAERLDVAVDATASSPSGPDSLDSENRFGLRFRFATLLVTIWWRDEKKLILRASVSFLSLHSAKKKTQNIHITNLLWNNIGYTIFRFSVYSDDMTIPDKNNKKDEFTWQVNAVGTKRSDYILTWKNHNT